VCRIRPAQDPASGDLLFCGPYTMAGAAGCMVSADGGHHFTALAQARPARALALSVLRHAPSPRQVRTMSDPRFSTKSTIHGC
jgi:hypothetical protein